MTRKPAQSNLPVPDPPRTRGRSRGDAAIVRSTEFRTWLESLKERVRAAHLRAAISVDAELVRLYWDVGHDILEKQRLRGWGAKVVEAAAADLRREFPDMGGWSRSNLMYMRAFAAAWTKDEIVQAPLGQLPWYHQLALLEKVKDKPARLVYAKLAVKNGWSRNVLVHQIGLNAAERFGASVTNFRETMPAPDSELAVEAVKSSYDLSFLGAAEKIRENALRKLLVDKVAQFLLELGTGFAYVGKGVHIEVGGDDFEMDLLFYHMVLHRYVVVELKTRKMKPQDVGQLGFYMAAVDAQVKTGPDGPTIGLLLCKSKNRLVAEYSLRNTTQPIGVSTYRLPAELPPADQIGDGVSRLLREERSRNHSSAKRTTSR